MFRSNYLSTEYDGIVTTISYGDFGDGTPQLPAATGDSDFHHADRFGWM